jgi:predicted Rossmann fold nucleotide-binding protein DprA/Smf involved in DNA uptake
MITANHALRQKKVLFAVPGPTGAFSSTGPNTLIRDGAKVATNAIDVLEYFRDQYAHKISIQGAKIRPTFDKDALNSMSSGEIDEKQKKYLKKFKKLKKENKEIIRSFKEKDSDDVEELRVEIPEFDPSMLGPQEKRLYDLLETGKPIVEDALLQHGFNIGEIMSILSMLEVCGAVEKRPGGFYVKR